MNIRLISDNDNLINIDTQDKSLSITEGSEIIKKVLDFYKISCDIALANFIEVNESGIYINIDSLNSTQEFIASMNEVFRNHYFKDLDYTIFSKLIFDLQGFKKNNNGKIKIASSIVEFDSTRKKKYQRPQNFNKSVAYYTFSTMFDTIEKDGENIDIEFIPNIDEFVSSMWSYGIKYGLQIEKIQKKMQSKQIEKIKIAEQTNFVQGNDASLITLENLGTDYGLVTTILGHVNYKKYVRVFPLIKEGRKIYKKKNSIPGQHGMDIMGSKIDAPEVKDIKIEELIENNDSGVKIVEENGIEYLVAETDGYVIPIQGNYNSQKKGEDKNNLVVVTIGEIKQKIKITKEIKLGLIGPETGNINSTGALQTRGISAGYYIKTDSANIIGYVGGSIVCKNDIKIVGNIYGGQHIVEEESVSIDGKIVSSEGNITIKGNLRMKSSLQAQKGEVNLENSELSTIIGKDIKIKNAIKTIFIGDNITIEGRCTDCIFIFTNSINAYNFKTNTNDENMIFIIKPVDYKNEIDQYLKKIEETKLQISKVKKIIEEITNENKLILEEKRFILYSSLKSKLDEDKNSISKEIVEALIKNKKWYEEKVFKLNQNNNKLIKINEIIVKLEKNLNDLNNEFIKISKLSRINTKPKINIRINSGELKISLINIPGINLIENLTDEDIGKLIDMNFGFNLITETNGTNINFEYK